MLKIDGKVSPADFYTKPKSIKETARLSEALNYDIESRKTTQEEMGAGVMEIANWMKEVITKKTEKKR